MRNQSQDTAAVVPAVALQNGAGLSADAITSRQGSSIRVKWVERGLAVLEPLSVAIFFLFLLSKTWLRWGDPLIDFPKDLYIDWRLSEGDLLYQQIVNWYGPLASLIEGAGFKVIGVGYDTLVGMNLGLTICALLLFRGIFRTIGNRLMAWLASLVFLGVFAFGHLGVLGNYNFITPYAAQATYSFFGLLLVLWGLLRHLKTERPIWLFVAGAGLAVAFLDKPEALLAGVGATAVYCLAQLINRARTGDSMRRWMISTCCWLVGGFLALWLPVFVYFCIRGGPSFALQATNHAMIFVWDSSFREAAMHERLMQVYSGLDQPEKNFLFESWRGGVFALLCAAMALAVWGWRRSARYGLQWWVLLLGSFVAAAGCAWFSYGGSDVGPELVFPVCIAAMAFTARSLWLAWRGGEGYAHALGLAVVGIAASLMMLRMILNARILHYGFFMMPLAMGYGMQLIAVEAGGPATRGYTGRWLLPALVSVLVLACTAALVRTSLIYYGLKTYAVGTGHDRFYTFQPQAYTTGEYLNTMIEAFKEKSPTAKSLVAFPEGIAVNYLLRIRTPSKELEFNPLALRYVNEEDIVQQMQANPPDAILLFDRDYSEFDESYFGANDDSGENIVKWISGRYKIIWTIGASEHSVSRHAIDLLVPMNSSGPP